MTDFSRYIGLRYRPLGRDFDGVDCWGLYRLILGHESGVWLPDHADDCPDPDDGDLAASAIVQHGVSDQRAWMRREKPAIFDAVLIAIAGRPCHIGCYVGSGQMLHSLRGHDSVLEPTEGVKWRNRVQGYWRPRELDTRPTTPVGPTQG